MESIIQILVSTARSVVPIVLLAGALGAALAMPWVKSASRPGLGTIASSSLLAGILLLVGRERAWLWLLSAIPAIMVFHQGMSLVAVRSTTVPTDGGVNRDLLRTMRLPEHKRSYLHQISESKERYFSLGVLLRSYIVPAVLLLGLCVTLFDATHDPDIRQWINLPPSMARAARAGFAGAYVYVLIVLGHRTYQRDVTVGAAMWSAITLALGPVLAAALASFWEPKAQDDLTNVGVYFLAGFSPRFVAETTTEMIRRTWFAKASPGTDRSVAITQVRGIDARIAERLAEEGITDTSSLAAADPIRLLRNTSFHKRQIVGWIDNALLHTILPKYCQALEDNGIRGAMDLAALASEGTVSTAEQQAAVSALAKAAGLEEALLRHAASALDRDTQVVVIILLYNLEDSEAAREGVVDETSPATRAAGAA